MCLPHCPTYGLSKQEADSPRGRISLLKALGDGSIAADDTHLNEHLDGCLQCRACENICPSQVPFSALMDAGHARRSKPSLSWKLSRYWTTHRRFRGFSRHFIQLHNAFRVALFNPLLPKTLQRMQAYLPKITKSNHSAIQPFQERIVLFRDCASEVFDPQTHDSVIQLLNALGVEAILPDTECCGALAAHQGHKQDADHLSEHNMAACKKHHDLPVLGCTSGCTAQLLDYPEPFAQRVDDVGRFILNHPNLSQLQFNALNKTAAVHLPCTLRNVIKAAGTSKSLLSLIPDLQIDEVTENHLCCGSAGSHMLTHPVQADRLLKPKLDDVETRQPDYLITHNIGCNLHWQHGLKQRGLAATVVSPFTLLAQQLKYNDDTR